MKVLLDTNVLSETRRPIPDPSVMAMLASVPPEEIFVSVISIGELNYCIPRLPDGKNRRELELWLNQTERNFASQILPVNRDIAHLWGELTARAAKAGRVLNPADGLVAATALHHGLRLVTKNTSDFEPTGIVLINPWAPASGMDDP